MADRALSVRHAERRPTSQRAVESVWARLLWCMLAHEEERLEYWSILLVAGRLDSVHNLHFKPM